VSGYVEAIEVQVSTKVGGVIEELLFTEGDRVAAAQVLARLDTTDIKLALAAATAERQEDEADLRLLLAGSRREEVAEAQAEVKRAESNLAGARQDLDRTAALATSGLETEERLDGARVRHDMALSSLEAARERLRKLETGSRQEEIDAARAAVATAEARKAQLEQQLADAEIVSPVDGIVTEKLMEGGELASRGSGIAIVTHLSEPWLNVFVAEPDLARIRIGQEAQVTTDDGQSRTGRVIFIASKAEFTPKNVQTRDERVKLVYKMKIGLENQDGMFKPGMPAEARLQPAAAAE
jgi:HlyD family secretion protein